MSGVVKIRHPADMSSRRPFRPIIAGADGVTPSHFPPPCPTIFIAARADADVRSTGFLPPAPGCQLFCPPWYRPLFAASRLLYAAASRPARVCCDAARQSVYRSATSPARQHPPSPDDERATRCATYASGDMSPPYSRDIQMRHIPDICPLPPLPSFSSPRLAPMPLRCAAVRKIDETRAAPGCSCRRRNA